MANHDFERMLRMIENSERDQDIRPVGFHPIESQWESPLCAEGVNDELPVIEC